MMLKDKDIKPKDFTLQNKLFRKFFYENSSSLDDVAHFVEITNQNIAKKVGITGKDQIVVVQNKNKYSKLEGGQDCKLLNLELERTDAFKEITDETLNEKYAEYLKEMGTQELADQFLLSENDEVNLFNRLLGFVE